MAFRYGVKRRFSSMRSGFRKRFGGSRRSRSRSSGGSRFQHPSYLSGLRYRLKSRKTSRRRTSRRRYNRGSNQKFMLYAVIAVMVVAFKNQLLAIWQKLFN